jgi:RNA polymerase sigma-70 factor (ECF subfamily)
MRGSWLGSGQLSAAGERWVRTALLECVDSLYSTASRLVGADLAEDLVQETARRALAKAPDLRDAGKARAWLFKILINCARDELRRQQRWSDYDEAFPAELWLDVQALQRATARDVRRALAAVDPARRAVILLIDLEGFKIAEAADILGVPPGTVASRLARARADLRRLLESYQPRAVGSEEERWTARKPDAFSIPIPRRRKPRSRAPKRWSTSTPARHARRRCGVARPGARSCANACRMRRRPRPFAIRCTGWRRTRRPRCGRVDG